MSKRGFKIVEIGTTYYLPEWEVIEGKGIEQTGNDISIQFVRGSKVREEKVESKKGILHETLLSMMIEDLKYKSSLVPSREGSLALTKLQEALHWMEERKKDRNRRKVEGTYKK